MLLTFLIAIPLLTACFIALLQTKHSRLIEKVVLVSSALELGFILLLLPSVVRFGSVEASALFSLDPLGAFLILVTALVGFFASWYSVGYLRAEVAKEIIGPHRVRQYFLSLKLFFFAMFLAVATTSPIIMWITIEATTLSTAFLISFYNKASATEAAWKYLIINSLGLLLSLLGTLLFLALPEMREGSLTWDMLRENMALMEPLIVKIAFVFVLVGYGTKVGFVPLHTWKPDTYSKAPTPIAALLSSVLLNVAFLAILRFKGLTDGVLGSNFAGELLIFFGVLSIAFAGLLMFSQKNYKRLLAYSSIEHAGLIALGFGFGGLGTLAALFHMLYHSLAKALIFFVAGNIFLKYSSTKIAQVTGMLSVLPVTAPVFFIAFLAVLGFPPFGLFMTEFLLLSSGMAEYPWVVAFVLLMLAIIFLGFLRHLTKMLFGSAPEGIERGESNMLTQWPVLLLAGLFLVLSWHVPEILSTLIEMAVTHLSLHP
ncbi:MAG: hydrogenase 4 subunit F [Candidatus Moranbacteria bacterium]|nr:hydrogenase 4 subunit F [Candidatus Moranbacteria bacterium]